MATSTTALSRVLETKRDAILSDWHERQLASLGRLSGNIQGSDLREQSREFLNVLDRSSRTGEADIMSASWAETREFLVRLSRARAAQGSTPTQTAMFVFLLKDSLYPHLRAASNGSEEEVWDTSRLLDALGLFTTEVYLKSREEVIARQQSELMELSTPVVKLWDQILALPLIGTLDSARTQVVMENLLQEIVNTGASIAIIDITGVPTVDTLVAQHLLKTVAAARLMGADCIISGIRPQIAQTIVHLGVDLEDVITKATLADAFLIALKRNGLGVRRLAANSNNS